METKKIRSYFYIFDGDAVVGRVKTQKQAKRYIENADRLRTAAAFAEWVEEIIEFVDSCEDEIGYEFTCKKDFLDVCDLRWPEIYDINADFGNGVFHAAFASGKGWHLVLAFTGDQVISTLLEFDEMTEFNRSCEKHGYRIENYRQEILLNIGGDVKKVMPVGFVGDMIVLQLAGGKQRWTASAEALKKLLA